MRTSLDGVDQFATVAINPVLSPSPAVAAAAAMAAVARSQRQHPSFCSVDTPRVSMAQAEAAAQGESLKASLEYDEAEATTQVNLAFTRYCVRATSDARVG